MNNVLFAFGLTLLAGMATGIGSIIAFTAKRTNYRFLSFVEIFYKGAESLSEHYGDDLGHWINAASFFGGMLLMRK